MANQAPDDAPGSVGIIGGGVIGTSVAFQLAKRGWTDVILFEKDQLGAGSTSKAAGGVRNVFSNPFNVELGNRYLDFFERFDEEVGHDLEFSKTGYLYLLHDEEEHEEWRERIRFLRDHGVTIEELGPEEAGERYPWLDPAPITGAVLGSDCGHVDPAQVAQAYARGAIDLGANIETKTAVTDVRVEDGRVVGLDTEAGDYTFDHVVNAAGPWARRIASSVGIDLPIELMARHIAVTSAIDGPEGPLVIDNRRNCYFRCERNGSLLVCNRDADIHDLEGPDAVTPGDIGYEYYRTIPEKFGDLVPRINDLDVINGWAGIQTHTPDKSPLVGPTPVEGFWIATGFSGHGIQKSPIVGMALADLLVEGETDVVDVDHFRLDRFDGDEGLAGEALNM